MKFKTFIDAQGYWRWHLKAANGRIIADSGEGYANRAGCLNGIALFKAAAYSAPVE